MKKEYDFSKAAQGKFYCAIENLEIPIYLDKAIQKFYNKKALGNKKELNQFVNNLLRKEMEVFQLVGV